MSSSDLFFPGWGVDPGLYRSLVPDAEIFDYGFFRDAVSPMRLPEEMIGSGKVIHAHSMGCAFALRCAAADSTVRKLVLWNPFPRFSRSGDFAGGWEPAEIDALRDGLRKDPVLTLKYFYRNCAFPDKIRPDVPAVRNPAALEDGLCFLAGLDERSLLTRIHCPVVVLTAKNDRIVNAAMSAPLELCATRSECFDGGHFLPFSGRVPSGLFLSPEV